MIFPQYFADIAEEEIRKIRGLRGLDQSANVRESFVGRESLCLLRYRKACHPLVI